MPANSYKTEEISNIVNGELFQQDSAHAEIELLLTDSRTILDAESSLFFAIKGDRNDGHRFIEELVNRGVHNFVFSSLNDRYKTLPANFILVNDTLEALQSLCAYHRKKFLIPVIGITGSNGKTVVKEWLYQLLREDKNIVRSPKSYNSQIGVPLSVWQINSDHQLALVEAGISKPGEMEKLEKVIQPSVGIFTNIGQAHDENFKH
jgi:UDP-N-acetylmuramyl pentapeptide synthase